MTKLLLAVHVLAAIITIGPVTVAASMFPPAARRAAAAPDDPASLAGLATVRTLHRICRVYAGIAVAVPVFGLATANSLHVLGSAWLITSIALTALAAAVLGAGILPRQGTALAAVAALAGPAGGAADPAAVLRAARRLGMYTGLFNLLWAAVTVLMIIRPGSTTGA
ncbi:MULTISPECIES: hypothetical protein [unclassified Streptomyces]|uniref:hypothetical protein n=1 Tax=unclassified Streptomyces TaxID=2593676 RepID=UPI002E11AE75|nr:MULTISPECIES: hypothetical protein [unclassified Streptomyces]WSR23090.1 hypothetical protein OG573_30790 [Streptomyces sp. NBC_01205]